jgi:hypothetical protein
MKAKLVYMSMVTRVVVDDNASEEEIIEKTKDRFIEKIKTDLGDNIEEIIDDEECPYDPKTD